MTSTVKESQPPSPKPYPNNITYICVSGRENNHIETDQPRHGEVIYVTKGKMLAWGGTAILEQLPSGTVMKTPIPNPYCRVEEEDHRRNMRIEAQIYAMIGEHPRVPKLIHWDQKTCCLEIEYLENGNLKEYILQNQQNITTQLQLRWSRQAAEALTVLHRFEVIHCDLSPRNFLLDLHLNLKIADFGGASLRGSDPSATPATRFRHPGYDWNTPPVFGDDIFSLGSLIIMTGCYPYEEVSSKEVEKLYDLQRFPDVSSIVCGAIIMQCWRRQVDSAQFIHDCLKAIGKGHFI
ncbi:STYKc [Aspergillus sclerotialis]|uniref:EKC/KEOPS complex subunit BUD32 n=1 Tax=Aspergillus sclerotialis TaxID=2070753 RepID=A0A3A2ZRA1_9EURO|nr:STYKc [Aspergillus sclerotialis]